MFELNKPWRPEEIAQHRTCCALRRGSPVPLRGKGEPGGQVVGEVLSHRLTIGDHRDAEPCQRVRRSDPGEQQQLWRTDRARREQHLASRTDLVAPAHLER